MHKTSTRAQADSRTNKKLYLSVPLHVEDRSWQRFVKCSRIGVNLHTNFQAFVYISWNGKNIPWSITDLWYSIGFIYDEKIMPFHAGIFFRIFTQSEEICLKEFKICCRMPLDSWPSNGDAAVQYMNGTVHIDLDAKQYWERYRNPNIQQRKSV